MPSCEYGRWQHNVKLNSVCYGTSEQGDLAGIGQDLYRSFRPNGASMEKNMQRMDRYYANPESQSFELDEYSIPDGTNVSVEVAAYMGATKTSDAFSYKRGCGKTANYSVTGATLTFDIKLASDEAVSSIKCINHGGFKMKFCVTWGDKKSGYSEYFFNPSSRTIDLDALDIPEWRRSTDFRQCSLGRQRNFERVCHIR